MLSAAARLLAPAPREQVLVGAHAVLANGGVIAPAGVHTVALAAKRHQIPFVVLVGLHKLSPLFPHDPDVTFNGAAACSCCGAARAAALHCLHCWCQLCCGACIAACSVLMRVSVTLWPAAAAVLARVHALSCCRCLQPPPPTPSPPAAQTSSRPARSLTLKCWQSHSQQRQASSRRRRPTGWRPAVCRSCWRWRCTTRCTITSRHTW